MSRPDRVLIGVISTVHGVRGEVIVRSFTDDPYDIESYAPLTDAEGGRPLALAIRGATSKGLIARVEGIESRDAAEALRGAELWVAREVLPEEQDGEFYYADLEGLAAVDLEGRAFGKVLRVVNFGAGDLLDVELTETGKTEFVPFRQAFVPDVDIAGGRIVVAWPLQYEIVPPDAGGTDDTGGEDGG